MRYPGQGQQRERGGRPGPLLGEQQRDQVVAHEGVSDAELSADVLSKIFLKQSPKFPSGVAAKPVDLKKDSPVRAQFREP